MPQFIFRGRVVIVGADFFVTADSLAEAERKAQAGDFHDIEYDRGDVIDYTIDIATGVEDA